MEEFAKKVKTLAGKIKIKSTDLCVLMLKGRILLVFSLFLGLLIGLPSFALTSPGSSSDPLVSKAWADKYINESFYKLEQNVASLKSQVAALKQGKHIVLYLDKRDATINGVTYTLDVTPRVVNNTTLLPLRFVGEGLDAVVNWDNNSKTITCIKGSVKVVLPINSKTAQINGKTHTLLAAPIVDNGRVLVPARFVAESFGATVTWNGAAKRVDIK